jgi:hypothetical protein
MYKRVPEERRLQALSRGGHRWTPLLIVRRSGDLAEQDNARRVRCAGDVMATGQLPTGLLDPRLTGAVDLASND